MMIGTLGYSFLVVGVVCSSLIVLLNLWALLKRKRAFLLEIRVLSAVGTLAVCAAFGLAIFLLVTGRFEYEMVYENTSRQMDMLQKATAVWGNKNGSLLFWSFLLSICVSLTVFEKWEGKKEAYFHGVVLLLQLFNLFFVALVAFETNPFARLWQLANGEVVASVFTPAGASPFTPADGLGLNPLLKHVGMIIHPPLLYLGFILYFVPFAFAIVSLWRRDYSIAWLRYSRTWLVLAWVFLTAGILLGCWWAYDILGWGGYWSWDPVEIAGLMPWLSGLGLLHCLHTYQSSTRVRRWCYGLMMGTVLLIIFGIYLSRTGVVASVHAYSQSNMGTAFMGFFLFLLLISLSSLAAHWKDLQPRGQRPAFLTPEGLTCILLLCLTLLVCVCLVGVTLPLTSQALTGQRIEPSTLYYEWSFAPPALIILLSIALGYLPRKKSLCIVSILSAIALTIITGIVFAQMNASAFVGFSAVYFALVALLLSIFYHPEVAPSKKEKNKGFSNTIGILLHLAFALLALGIVGSQLDESQVVSLQNGQSTTLGNWQVTKTTTKIEESANKQILYAEEYVFLADGKEKVILQPLILWYEDTHSTVSSPAIHSTLLSDTYAAIIAWDGNENGKTTVLLSTFPFMQWLWLGGSLLILCTLCFHFSKRILREEELQQDEQNEKKSA